MNSNKLPSRRSFGLSFIAIALTPAAMAQAWLTGCVKNWASRWWWTTDQVCRAS
jgi:hypothetical protein